MALFELVDDTLKSREEIVQNVRMWLIPTFCTVSLAIGFIITFTTTPIYRATVTIQIDRQEPRIVKTDADLDFQNDTYRFYESQYELLKSRMLAERVASDLNLVSAPDFLNPPSTSPWRKLRSLILPSGKSRDAATEDNREAGDVEQRKAAAAGMVQAGLSFDPVRDSNLVRISFDSPSADWAARIANDVADSYVTSNLDRRYGATAYARNFLKERLDELKLKLEESKKALVACSSD
jgi:succinoglycan biosynthesis transport protein ExoP